MPAALVKYLIVMRLREIRIFLALVQRFHLCMSFRRFAQKIVLAHKLASSGMDASIEDSVTGVQRHRREHVVHEGAERGPKPE